MFSPNVAIAEVIVNEIAWTGSAGNANAEWIELRNTGSTAVSLEGWSLSAEDGSPAITLVGTIVAGGFFLLERTSDESVPGVTADQIYSGALGNSGETLTLKNSSGQSVDVVSGGENWENVGGDNTTKDTAQRTSTGWITGSPTPRAANTSSSTTPPPTEETSDEEDDTETSSTPVSSSGGGTPASSSALVSKASAGKDRVVVVGVDTRLEGFAYDSGNRVIDNARFVWNFGDGTNAEGKVVTHRWQYPGRYAVVLEVTRFESKASHRVTVTAETAELALQVSPDGGVIIENRSNRDVDLSGWRIVSNEVVFTFSPNTIVIRNASIQLSSFALRFNASSQAALLYPDGSIAVQATTPAVKEAELEEEIVVASTSEPVRDVPVVSTKKASLPPAEKPKEIVEETPEIESEPKNIENAAAAALVVEGGGASLLWWLGIVLVVILGGVAIFAARHLRQREWKIIEETENDV